MEPALRYPTTSWFFKGCESTLAAIALVNILLFPLGVMPASFWEKYGQYFQYVLIGTCVVAVVSSVLYTWRWHRRERTGNVNSGLRHAWLQGIIRYWLAFSIATYGFAKILKTQFDTPAYQLDMPVGDLNGFQLTWFYFGYSYTLAVIIALFQIGGSILLLYRRTTLLGTMILLPVMVNIVLINVFFSIAVGAFFNSVIYTLGLTFLLLLDWAKLKRAFWDLVERLPPVTLGRNWVKPVLRLLPVALAFGIIQYLVSTNKSDTSLRGAWKVERLSRNGRVVPATAWLTDTTAWNRVYFAGWQGCIFSPNPYRYKATESLWGSYQFDSTTNYVLIAFPRRSGHERDTLRAAVSQRSAKAMRLEGVLKGDTLAMQLSRLR